MGKYLDRVNMTKSTTSVLGALMCLLLAACSDPQKKAQKRLEKQGIAFEASAFVDAVSRGQVFVVKDFLAGGMPVDSSGGSGKRPFYIALEAKNQNLANLLIDAGASYIGAGDERPVLRLAVEQDAAHLVKKLLDAGASRETRKADGTSLLASAISEGAFASAKVMIEEGVDVHGHDSSMRPTLHLAIDNEQYDLLELLLEGGVDASLVDEHLVPALILALRNQDLQAADLLMKYRADPNATAADRRAALTLSLENKQFEFSQALLDAGANPLAYSSKDLPPIHHVLAFEDAPLSLLRGLVQAGADVNVLNPKGFTPLEMVLHRKQYIFAKLFLESGANPGNSVYQVAHAGDQRGLLMLLEREFDVNPKGDRDTPLGIAVRKKNMEMASLLLAHGADPNAKTGDGQSPLHLAVIREDKEFAKLLLDKGADAKKPFIEPVSKEFRVIAKSKRMQWFLREDRRVTPLMVAADAGNVELSKLLLDAGADTNDYTRKHRMWAINFAARNDDIPVMRLMLGKDPHYEDRKVIIDLSDQLARVFGKDGKVIMSFRVSSGKKGHRTPKGKFVITNKYKDWTSTLYHSKMPYFQRLNCGDFGLHEGYVPKYAASHGCIRVPKGTARKLYKVTKLGDRVEIVP